MKNKNPIHKYPQPPFKEQHQSFPGIESKMTPQADHGEESYIGNQLLKDKKVLITGGDSGIGKAIAIAYAREGADVMINYLDKKEDADALDTKKWVEQAGRKCILVRGDIVDPKFCQQLISSCIDKLGGIDILINNAAFQKSYEKFEDIADTEWTLTFDTNITAMFYLSKYAYKHIPTGGSIINTASVNSYDPNPSLLPYATTKSAIQSFTASLSKLFMQEKTGIRVNAVAPGPIWTPLIPSTIPEHTEFGSQSPMGRPGQPAEIAPIFVFLASEAASYISGATIPATGGQITL